MFEFTSKESLETSILSDTQPIVSPDGSYTLLDKIVYACCALNNICDSVISFVTPLYVKKKKLDTPLKKKG